MHDVFFVHFAHALKNLSENIWNLVFFEVQTSTEQSFQIHSIAVFYYQIIVSRCFQKCVRLNYVWRVKPMKHSLFIFKVLYHPLAHLASAELFARIHFTIAYVATLIYCGVCALADFLQQHIISYFSQFTSWHWLTHSLN
jgi:hypothetical protein